MLNRAFAELRASPESPRARTDSAEEGVGKDSGLECARRLVARALATALVNGLDRWAMLSFRMAYTASIVHDRLECSSQPDFLK